jgi:outer membrane lipoprotein-sorting protein
MRHSFRAGVAVCFAIVCLGRLGAQTPATPSTGSAQVPSTSSGQASSPTVDEIVQKYLAAKGGADKLRAVQSVKTVGHVKGPGGEVAITSYAKRPNMMRRETTRQGQTAVVAVDGKTVWALNPLRGPQAQEVTGPQAEAALQDASDFDSMLLDYKQKGYSLDFVGLDKAGGIATYHLKIMRNGRPQDLYLNAETMLETRMTMDVDQGGRKGLASIEFSNYKPVEGIMVPFTIRQSFDGQLLGEVVYDTIQFNLPVDDGLFRKPS